MAERELVRQKEAEAKGMQHYEVLMDTWAKARERAKTGRVVIRAKEMPFEQGRQGYTRVYLHLRLVDTALANWMVFLQEIRVHSGRHIHQGGIALFVLQGKGYTVVDGVKHDWEEGDLILLPVKPGGVEHQHFNVDPDKPSRWLAMGFFPFFDALGNNLEQVEVHPDWKSP